MTQKNRLDKLNRRVSSIISKIEEAQTNLALAELAIARETTPTSVEGMIARRGAIRAARAARLDDLTKELLEIFLAEDGIDERQRAELNLIAIS